MLKTFFCFVDKIYKLVVERMITNGKIELEASELYFDDLGILWIIHKDGTEMDIEKAKEHAEACYKMCNGNPTRMIIDARGKYAIITPEAKDYLAHNEEIIKIRKAHAILVDSVANRLLANFYFKFNKPLGPGKVFNSKQSALLWLSKYK